MNTNKFHIIPQYLLRKFKHSEDKETFSLSLDENLPPVKSINKFHFDVNETANELHMSNSEKKDLKTISNIIEDLWNESEFEDKLNEKLQLAKDEIKRGQKFIIMDNSLKNFSKSMWNRFDLHKKNKNNSSVFFINENILNLILSFLSTMMDVEGQLIKFKKRFYREIKTNKMIFFIKSIIKMVEEKQDLIKQHDLHPNAKTLDWDDNTVIAFVFQHKQPLRSVPYNRIPVELIDSKFQWLAPYGYDIFQLNPKSTLITINTIDKTTNHSKILDAFNSMENDELNETLKYFYFNSYACSDDKIFSSNKDELYEFKNKIIDFKNTNINKSLVIETMEEYSNYLEDFNVSSTIRNEYFYIPLSYSLNRITEKISIDEDNYCHIASKILPPANYFNKRKTLFLKRIFDEFYYGIISKDEMLNLVDWWMEESIYFVTEILKMDLEKYVELMFRKNR